MKKIFLAFVMGLILGTVSSKADHNSNRFVQCTFEQCEDKGEAGLYSKVSLSRIKDSKAV